MRRLRLIFFLSALLLLPFMAKAQTAVEAEEDEIDVTEIIFEHVGDAYEWHITTINEKPVAIYLPVILHSRTSGWHGFSSKRIAEGQTYEGFHLAAEGEKHEGKIVEDTPGGTVKPLDISITKNVVSLMLTSLIIMVLVLCAARWYKKHDAVEEAPKGFAGLMEMLVTMVEDDIIKECVGKDYKRYSPYLLTAFFFIFINNLLGIIPFFPFGANVTGNIAVTMFLAVCTFIAVNVFANKHYWKDILWPDVPAWLKVPLPLMPVIEIIGMFTKPFSLMVRLFANILAGHCMIIGVVCVVFLTAKMGAGMNAGLSVVAVFIGVFMDVLELLVAFLQAYVFTMLSSVFIGLSRQEPETE
ncbi:MAG: F0F1 ATP synthase subunit A [Bacteroidia bacterium]|nr:F0F1 ATP synthase subunit A [Bacteroidia bacterium]